MLSSGKRQQLSILVIWVGADYQEPAILPELLKDAVEFNDTTGCRRRELRIERRGPHDGRAEDSEIKRPHER